MARRTSWPDIAIAVRAKYEFQRELFDSLAQLLGVKVKEPPVPDEKPDRAAVARKLDNVLTALSEKG